MHTDGLFTTCEYTIHTRLDQTTWLRPFSDVHRFAELHAKSEWQDWLRYTKENPDPAVYLGGGDYDDFMRAHARALSDANDIVDSSISDNLQNSARENVYAIAEELGHLRGKLIGLLSGNHYFVFSDKSKRGVVTKEHSDHRLATLLGVPYLGTMSLITLRLVDSKNPANRAEVRVIAHHGVGGGATIGGSLNRVNRTLSGWHADVALFGHDHKRGIVPVGDKLKAVILGSGKTVLTADSKWVGRTGSFLRGFEPGKSSYVVDMAYEPSSIGTIEVQMKLKKDRKTGQCRVALGGFQPA